MNKFTKRQMKAVIALERVLKRLSKEGVGLIGLDTDLIAVRPEQYRKYWRHERTMQDTLEQIEDEGGEFVNLEDDDCYIDSGAT